MAKGFYPVATPNSEDCEAWPASYANANQNARVGVTAGIVRRMFLRVQLDIPAGATITSARLWVFRASVSGSPPNPQVFLLNYDNCPAFTTNPYSWSVSGDPSTLVIAANGWNSVDVINQVQSFVNRPGYSPGNYIGLTLRADGATNEHYHNIRQSNDTYRKRCILIVTYRTATTAVVSSAGVQFGDDTYNKDIDSTGRITETGLWVGRDVGLPYPYNRIFLRFPLALPKSGNILYSQILVVLAGDASSYPGVEINTLADHSVFPSGESIFSRAVKTGQTPVSWTIGSGTLYANEDRITPNLKALIQDRVNESDYNPGGSDPNNHVAMRITYVGDPGAGTIIGFASRENATALPPHLLVEYERRSVSISAPIAIATAAAITPQVAITRSAVVPAPGAVAAAEAPAPQVILPAQWDVDIFPPTAVAVTVAQAAQIIAACNVRIDAPASEASSAGHIPSIATAANISAPAAAAIASPTAGEIRVGVAISVLCGQATAISAAPAVTAVSAAIVEIPCSSGIADTLCPSIHVGPVIAALTAGGSGNIFVPAIEISTGIIIPIPLADISADTRSPGVTTAVFLTPISGEATGLASAPRVIAGTGTLFGAPTAAAIAEGPAPDIAMGTGVRVAAAVASAAVFGTSCSASASLSAGIAAAYAEGLIPAPIVNILRLRKISFVGSLLPISLSGRKADILLRADRTMEISGKGLI